MKAASSRRRSSAGASAHGPWPAGRSVACFAMEKWTFMVCT